jgi:hypothetical protein
MINSERSMDAGSRRNLGASSALLKRAHSRAQRREHGLDVIAPMRDDEHLGVGTQRLQRHVHRVLVRAVLRHDERHQSLVMFIAKLGDQRHRLRILAGARDHHHAIGLRDFAREIAGVSGDIVEPALHGLARRGFERQRLEESRAVPMELGDFVDQRGAGRIERDHLHGARLRIRILNPETRFLSGRHARRFTQKHGWFLISFSSMVMSVPSPLAGEGARAFP